MECGEGDAEVDGVGRGGGLDRVGFEDGALAEWAAQYGYVDRRGCMGVLLTMARTLRRGQICCSANWRTSDIRPHLTALLRHDCEA